MAIKYNKIWIYYCLESYCGLLIFCVRSHSYCRCETTRPTTTSALVCIYGNVFIFQIVMARRFCSPANGFCIFNLSWQVASNWNIDVRIVSGIPFATKNSMRPQNLPFSMRPWIKAALLRHFSAASVPLHVNRRSQLMIITIISPLFSHFEFVSFSVPRERQRTCECICECLDGAVSWKNSNRCQTNRTLVFWLFSLMEQPQCTKQWIIVDLNLIQLNPRVFANSEHWTRSSKFNEEMKTPNDCFEMNAMRWIWNISKCSSSWTNVVM